MNLKFIWLDRVQLDEDLGIFIISILYEQLSRTKTYFVFAKKKCRKRLMCFKFNYCIML